MHDHESKWRKITEYYHEKGLVSLIIAGLRNLIPNNIQSKLPHRVRKKLLQNKLYSKETLHEYWRSRNTEDNNQLLYDDENSIDTYLANKDRSSILKDEITNLVDSDASIIELGCNVGRNLNYLYTQGYENLEAIEINQKALDVGRDNYPGLFEDTEFHQGSIEDNIKNFSNNEFDVIFTSAVLEHIHVESEWIFEEMARITKGYIITLEPEVGLGGPRGLSRNYGEIFTKFGFENIKTIEGEEAAQGSSEVDARINDKNRLRVFATVENNKD